MCKRKILFIIGMSLALSTSTFLYAQNAGSGGKAFKLKHNIPINKKVRQKNGPREKWPCLDYKKRCGKASTRKPKKHTLSGELNGNSKRGKMIALKKGKTKVTALPAISSRTVYSMAP